MFSRDSNKGLLLTCLHWVLLFGLSGLAGAQDANPAPLTPHSNTSPFQGPSTNQESEARQLYQRLKQRREAALIQYNYIIPGKRTARRREEAFRQFYPHPKDWAPRFFQVQEDYPGTVAAGQSLVWIVRHWKDSELELKSRALLLKNYLRMPFLYEICHSLERAKQPRGKQDLLYLFQHSPVDTVKAHACQALCELGMDELQFKASDLLRASIEEYVQLLGTRFAATQIGEMGGAAWSARYRLELDHLSLGQKVLDWKGLDLHGQPQTLAESRGHVVLLFFWKSSSRQARLALPHVRSLLNKYGDQNFQVFGVSGDLNLARAKRWNKALQIKFPSWHVPSTESDPGIWGVTSWPRYYVLSPKGRVLAARCDWAEARSAVQAAMAEVRRHQIEDAPIPAADGSTPKPKANPPAPDGEPAKPKPDPKAGSDKQKGPLRRKDS